MQALRMLCEGRATLVISTDHDLAIAFILIVIVFRKCFPKMLPHAAVCLGFTPKTKPTSNKLTFFPIPPDDQAKKGFSTVVRRPRRS